MRIKKHLSKNSEEAYQLASKDFQIFLGVKTQKEVENDLCSYDYKKGNNLIKTYRSNLQERKLSSATINLRLSYLRRLIRSLRDRGLLEWAADVTNVKSQNDNIINYISPKMFKILIDSIEFIYLENRIAKMKRDKAILNLIYILGLRRDKVVNLNLNDIDFKKWYLFIKENRKIIKRFIPKR